MPTRGTLYNSSAGFGGELLQTKDICSIEGRQQRLRAALARPASPARSYSQRFARAWPPHVARGTPGVNQARQITGMIQHLAATRTFCGCMLGLMEARQTTWHDWAAAPPPLFSAT